MVRLSRRPSSEGNIVAKACVTMLMILASANASSQIIQPTAPLPSFETATFKPSDPNRVPGPMAPQPNVFKSYGGTVRDLIRVAFGLPPSSSQQVLGGPAWIDHERFDVEAKIPDELFLQMKTMEPQQRSREMLSMVQHLLADRLNLKTHFETREMSVYTLVVAHGGPKLQSSQPGQRPQLTASMKRPGVMEVTASSQTLDAFVGMPFLGIGGAPVVNKTGLHGTFDFVLDWSTQQSGMEATAASAENVPDLFSALQNQLGLKLVRSKEPVEVVVIDSIDQPTAN